MGEPPRLKRKRVKGGLEVIKKYIYNKKYIAVHRPIKTEIYVIIN